MAFSPVNIGRQLDFLRIIHQLVLNNPAGIRQKAHPLWNEEALSHRGENDSPRDH